MLEKLKKNKYVPYIIIFISSLIISFVFFTMNLSEYNEARIHIGRIIAIKQVLLDGIFPSFISPKHMLGFGYALNIFYGAITTYVPILFSFIGNSSIVGLKIFTFFTVFLSGITMYKFLLEISKRRLIALLGAIIYIIAPYKLTDIYSRNAVGEYTAFIFIPLVFLGLHKLLYEKKRNYYLLIGAVGLILSHTITTIYTALFSLIYIIFNFKKLIDKDVIKYLAIDVILILLLSAFYLFPLLEHKIYGNYAIFDSEEMGATGKYVQNTGLELKDFFKSEFGSQEIVFSFGLVIIFGLALTPFCIKKQKNNEYYILFFILSLISFVMCTKAFPWIAMPNLLTIIQFAWRQEGFFIFFISYICASNIVCISDMLPDRKNIIAILVIIASFLCSFFGTYRYFDNKGFEPDKKYEKVSIENVKIGPYNINREYLPINALYNINYMKEREDRAYLLDGNCDIQNEVKDGLKLSFSAKNVQNAKLELPYIFYHGYTIKINDKKIKGYESDKGFLCIDLNEEGDVTVEYTGTFIDKLGYAISGTTLVALIGYNLVKNRRKIVEK